MSVVVVITGGIGSGKSAASAVLSRMCIPVYDCDSRVKTLYGTHPELAAMVTKDLFANPEALSKLEDALFPVLMQDFREWQEAHCDACIVGLESATILDKPFFDGFGDYILYVTAPENVRLERALARNTISADSVRERMSLQRDHSNDPRVTKVINNDSSLQQLEIQIIDFIKQIQENGKGKN